MYRLFSYSFTTTYLITMHLEQFVFTNSVSKYNEYVSVIFPGTQNPFTELYFILVYYLI
jgi:hypothetical protein